MHDVNQDRLLTRAYVCSSAEERRKIVENIDKEHVWQLYQIWQHDEFGIMAIFNKPNFGYDQRMCRDILKRRGLKYEIRQRAADACNNKHTLLWCYVREESDCIKKAIADSWWRQFHHSDIEQDPEYPKFVDEYKRGK